MTTPSDRDPYAPNWRDVRDAALCLVFAAGIIFLVGFARGTEPPEVRTLYCGPGSSNCSFNKADLHEETRWVNDGPGVVRLRGTDFTVTYDVAADDFMARGHGRTMPFTDAQGAIGWCENLSARMRMYGLAP